METEHLAIENTHNQGQTIQPITPSHTPPQKKLDVSARESDDDTKPNVPVALDLPHGSVARDVAMRVPLTSMPEPVPFEKERREMIEVQLRRRGIRDERVLEAMFQVPRHEFVPPAFLKAAYEDRPLPIGQSETISQPYIVAAMTLAARVEAGDKALEVGTGSGYQAAILAYLGAKLYTVERNLQLAEAARARLARLKFAGIEVIGGDGSEGYPPAAPYQIILVTAAAPDVPPLLLDELAEGGRMVIPVGDLFHQDLLLILKHHQNVARRVLDPCQFVPLIGKGGWPERGGPHL